MHTSLKSGVIAGLAIAVTVGSSAGCSLIAGIEEAYLDDKVSQVALLAIDPTSCSSDIVLDEDLIRGCLMRVSCDPYLPPVNLSACVSYATQVSSTREACTYEALDCEVIDDCLGREYADEDELALCDGSAVWACDVDEALYCGGVPLKVDCEQFQTTCVGHADVDRPEVVGCAASISTECSDSGDESYYCDGNVLYTCVDGVPLGRDCGADGSTCVEQDGEGFCHDSSTTCSALNTYECDDGVLTVCDEWGLAADYDCSEAGLGCSIDSSGSGACLANGCPSFDDCEERCLDGYTLQFCVGGAKVNLDCALFGLGSCYESELSGSGVEFAGCSVGPDSCVFALDSQCDEGSNPNADYYCAPGTDTTDCR